MFLIDSETLKKMQEDGKNWYDAKPGKRVQILTKIATLKHRKNKNGVITRCDGQYVYVRPMWCKYEIECYIGEFKII